MNFVLHRPSHRFARNALRIAVFAMVFAALSPLFNALRPNGQARLPGEPCALHVAGTSGGPQDQERHGPDCAWCVSAATWLGHTGLPDFTVPAGPAGHAVLAAELFAAMPPRRAHTVARSRAPPVLI